MDSTSRLSGWGRTFVLGRERRAEDLSRAVAGATLSRGLGRSYGDSSLPARDVREIVGTALADRVLSFDEQSGVLRAEAGLSLLALNRIFLPRGYFPPVTPGTQLVTLGGMVASDVHGKNHHVAGTIGRHVRALRVQLADGRTLECSRSEEPELFRGMLGSMGLLGHILEVELTLERIPSPWIYQESFRIPTLSRFLEELKRAGERWPMTVGWIDTAGFGSAMGRGILFCGRWATAAEAPREPPAASRPLRMPFALPSGLLNRTSIAAFNSLVYHRHMHAHDKRIVSPETFFYPLDRVLQWNLLYGRRGVTQHQAVIPDEAGPDGVKRLLSLLRESGACSFLTVMKDCGAEGEGLLSFPRPGISIALDIPIREGTQAVVDRLNEHVIACGGRIYLTKDGFTRAAHFRAMEPRLARFLEVKRRWDPEHRLRSAQSERLFGEEAS